MNIRNKNAFLLVASLVLLISYEAVASPDDTLDECLSDKKNMTTAGMTNCTNSAAVSWDKELNRVYKELMNKLTGKGKNSLKQSQRQWLKYRDSEIQFIEDMYYRREFSGTMYIPMRAMDKLQVTKARTIELIKYLGKHK